MSSYSASRSSWRKIVKLKRSLISASVYPVIVITVAIGIVVAIMIFVIPTFAELFKNMNATSAFAHPPCDGN